MADNLTLKELSQLCHNLEAAAKKLAEWADWGALATKTEPGARTVYVPGCLDPEVLQQRGRDLVTAAQAIADATAIQPDPGEEEIRKTLDAIPTGAGLEDEGEELGIAVKHWYVGFYTGEVPESIEDAYGEVLAVFNNPTLPDWEILSSAVDAIEYDLSEYPDEDWGDQFPSVEGNTKQEKVASLFADREKWFCIEMVHETLGPVFAFYGDWSGAEGFYWAPEHRVIQPYSPN